MYDSLQTPFRGPTPPSGQRLVSWGAAALIAAALPTDTAASSTGDLQRTQFALVVEAVGRDSLQVRRAFEAMAVTHSAAQDLAAELDHHRNVNPQTAKAVQRAADTYRPPAATEVGVTVEQRRVRLAGLIGAVADMEQRGTDPSRVHQHLRDSPTPADDWHAVTALLAVTGYSREIAAFESGYDQWLRNRPGEPNPRFEYEAAALPFADMRAAYGRPDRLAVFREGLGLGRPRWERTAEVAAYLPTVGPADPDWGRQIRALQPYVERASWRQLRTVIEATGVIDAPAALRAATANGSPAAARAVERALERSRLSQTDRPNRWQLAVWEATIRTPVWRRVFVAAAARPGADVVGTAAALDLMGPQMYTRVAERVLLRAFPGRGVADQHRGARAFHGINNDTPAVREPPRQGQKPRIPDADRSASLAPRPDAKDLIAEVRRLNTAVPHQESAPSFDPPRRNGPSTIRHPDQHRHR